MSSWWVSLAMSGCRSLTWPTVPRKRRQKFSTTLICRRSTTCHPWTKCRTSQTGKRRPRMPTTLQNSKPLWELRMRYPGYKIWQAPRSRSFPRSRALQIRPRRHSLNCRFPFSVNDNQSPMTNRTLKSPNPNKSVTLNSALLMISRIRSRFWASGKKFQWMPNSAKTASNHKIYQRISLK